MCYNEYLKKLEESQYRSGKVNPEQKAKEMGKQAKKELEQYPLDEDFTPFN